MVDNMFYSRINIRGHPANRASHVLRKDFRLLVMNPSSPCPLLPQGEKGEFGRPDAETEDGTQGLAKKSTP